MVYKNKVVQAIAYGAGAADGDWINTKYCKKLWILVGMYQANAAIPTITIEKGTGDGVGATAITSSIRIWSNLSTATSDTFVARTPAVSYALDAGTANKAVVFEIDPEGLGETYSWVRVRVSASNAANICHAYYQLDGMRYAQEIPPSTI